RTSLCSLSLCSLTLWQSALLRSTLLRSTLFCSALFLGTLLVIGTSVISDIETRAFENQPCARADKAFHRARTPSFKPAGFFRTDSVSLVLHRLENLKCLIALLALILVGRHR